MKKKMNDKLNAMISQNECANAIKDRDWHLIVAPTHSTQLVLDDDMYITSSVKLRKFQTTSLVKHTILLNMCEIEKISCNVQ